MKKCISLAQKGLGLVAPNPLVGAVLVYKDSIIGEGYHHNFGGPHAEVHAINSVLDKSLLKDSILYINLEPCCHVGKTPPCVELIREYNIKKVVVGCKDPYPEVAGKGIEFLKQHNIEVIIGVLEKECRALNSRFLTYHEKKRPYIILKWAQTRDNFIAQANYDSKWISSIKSRTLVHKWRSEEMAVMVGTNTVIYDNPHLTCRLVLGKNPIRILIDKMQRVPTSFNIFDESAPTLLFNEIENFTAKGATLIKIDFSGDVINQILLELFKREIQSVLVEGGAKLLQSFIDKDLFDEVRMFKSNKVFGEGILAPSVKFNLEEEDEYREEEVVGESEPEKGEVRDNLVWWRRGNKKS